MARTSYFKLVNGSGSRISPEDETEKEVITALLHRWGDRLLTVTINGKIIEVRR